MGASLKGESVEIEMTMAGKQRKCLIILIDCYKEINRAKKITAKADEVILGRKDLWP